MGTLMYFNKRLINWFRERFNHLDESFESILDSIDDSPPTSGSIPSSGGGPRASNNSVRQSAAERRRGSGGHRESEQETALFATWAEIKAEGVSRVKRASTFGDQMVNAWQSQDTKNTDDSPTCGNRRGSMGSFRNAMQAVRGFTISPSNQTSTASS